MCFSCHQIQLPLCTCASCMNYSFSTTSCVMCRSYDGVQGCFKGTKALEISRIQIFLFSSSGPNSRSYTSSTASEGLYVFDEQSCSCRRVAEGWVEMEVSDLHIHRSANTKWGKGVELHLSHFKAVKGFLFRRKKTHINMKFRVQSMPGVEFHFLSALSLSHAAEEENWTRTSVCADAPTASVLPQKCLSDSQIASGGCSSSFLEFNETDNHLTFSLVLHHDLPAESQRGFSSSLRVSRFFVLYPSPLYWLNFDAAPCVVAQSNNKHSQITQSTSL